MFVTTESSTGDLAGVESKLYVVAADQSVTLVRVYPGELFYELLGSPNGRHIAVTAGPMLILDPRGNEEMRLHIAAPSFSGAGPFASWSADSRYLRAVKG